MNTGAAEELKSCHTVLFQFLATKEIPVLPQPSCSPDLSSCDFLLFPKLKFSLKRRHFGGSWEHSESCTPTS